jgi:hypothetical protein
MTNFFAFSIFSPILSIVNPANLKKRGKSKV